MREHGKTTMPSSPLDRHTRYLSCEGPRQRRSVQRTRRVKGSLSFGRDHLHVFCQLAPICNQPVMFELLKCGRLVLYVMTSLALLVERSRELFFSLDMGSRSTSLAYAYPPSAP